MNQVKSKTRLYFVDNLRFTMICIVVFFHASITYGPIGDWFFRDLKGTSEGSDILLMIFIVFSQAFFMGLLFLLAGYFVPGSFQRKGTRKFIKDRVWRLVIPALIFIFLIFPPMNYLLNKNYYNEKGISFIEYIFRYLPDIANWDTGPLWFTLALLFFTLIWIVVPTKKNNPNMNSKMKLKQWHLILLIIVMAFATFLVRVVFPIGTKVWNMQLCFFPQYFTLFIFGIFAFKNNWLNTISIRMILPWKILIFILAIFGFPILLVSGGALEGDLSHFEGGWHWQSLALSFWGEAFAVAVCLTLIVIYRERYNIQGRISKFLSENAFAVYIFHAPVVVGIGVGLSMVDAPTLVKFPILATSSLFITYLLSDFILRKISFLRNIL